MVVRLRVLRKLREALMAKNAPQRGKSARNGNAPSPYTKQRKTPHRYSAAYYDWFRDRKAGKPISTKSWHGTEKVREYKMAAE